MLRICSRLRHKDVFGFSPALFCFLLMLQLSLITCGGSGGGSGSDNGDPLGDMDGTWDGTVLTADQASLED